MLHLKALRVRRRLDIGAVHYEAIALERVIGADAQQHVQWHELAVERRLNEEQIHADQVELDALPVCRRCPPL